MVPTANGDNGRDSNGRFTKGNSGGPGNPHARRTARIRRLILDSVSDDDIRATLATLVNLARGGDLAAIRELLDRTAGKAVPAVDPDRVDLEALKLGEAYRDAKSTINLWSIFKGALDSDRTPDN